MSGETRSTFSWIARHLFINIIHMTRQEHLNQGFRGKNQKSFVEAVQLRGKKLGMNEELPILWWP